MAFWTLLTGFDSMVLYTPHLHFIETTPSDNFTSANFLPQLLQVIEFKAGAVLIISPQI